MCYVNGILTVKENATILELDTLCRLIVKELGRLATNVTSEHYMNPWVIQKRLCIEYGKQNSWNQYERHMNGIIRVWS